MTTLKDEEVLDAFPVPSHKDTSILAEQPEELIRPQGVQSAPRPSHIPSGPGQAVITRLVLPLEVIAAYSLRAERANKTVEETLAEQLTKTVNYTAEKPIYFDDAQRVKLEQLLGKNYSEPESFVRHIESSASFMLNEGEEVIVSLTPNIWQRLRNRLIKGKTFPEFVREVTVQALEQYVGLR